MGKDHKISPREATLEPMTKERYDDFKTTLKYEVRLLRRSITKSSLEWKHLEIILKITFILLVKTKFTEYLFLRKFLDAVRQVLK